MTQYVSDTYIKLRAAKKGAGYEGCITCFLKETNEKIWEDRFGIIRLTKEDAIADVKKEIAFLRKMGISFPWEIK